MPERIRRTHEPDESDEVEMKTFGTRTTPPEGYWASNVNQFLENRSLPARIALEGVAPWTSLTSSVIAALPDYIPATAKDFLMGAAGGVDLGNNAALLSGAGTIPGVIVKGAGFIGNRAAMSLAKRAAENKAVKAAGEMAALPNIIPQKLASRAIEKETVRPSAKVIEAKMKDPSIKGAIEKIDKDINALITEKYHLLGEKHYGVTVPNKERIAEIDKKIANLNSVKNNYFTDKANLKIESAVGYPINGAIVEGIRWPIDASAVE